MATPCDIVQEINGHFRRATVRSGGYVSGVGAYLLKFYQNANKVSDLVSLGSILVIEADPADCRQQPHAESYAVTFDTLEAALTEPEEYVYLWRDGKWHFAEIGLNDGILGEFEEITREIILAEDPEVEPLLDGLRRPITFDEAVRVMYGQRN